MGELQAEERRRPALSPSRAADFRQCPLLYRFRVVDRLPESPSPAALRGTLVHAVLERLFDLPAGERVPEAAKGLLGAVWAEIVAEAPELVAVVPEQRESQPESAPESEPAPESGSASGPAPESEPASESGSASGPASESGLESGHASDPAFASEPRSEPQATPDRIGAWLASAADLLDTYFAMEDPRALEPVERELLVETELASGVPLRGYLDRLDVDAAGELRIVDYKTGSAPREAGESRALFQMKFYALALLELRGRVPDLLRLVYLGRGGEELTYRPEAAELRRFQRILEAIWAAIVEADRTGDFRPHRGPGCAWCDHKALCPAWEGTPPPYPGWPELRGEAPTVPFGAAAS